MKFLYHNLKANANGFYALNSKSVVDFTEGSKAKDVCEFLEKIKDENRSLSENEKRCDLL